MIEIGCQSNPGRPMPGGGHNQGQLFGVGEAGSRRGVVVGEVSNRRGSGVVVVGEAGSKRGSSGGVVVGESGSMRGSSGSSSGAEVDTRESSECHKLGGWVGVEDGGGTYSMNIVNNHVNNSSSWSTSSSSSSSSVSATSLGGGSVHFNYNKRHSFNNQNPNHTHYNPNPGNNNNGYNGYVQNNRRYNNANFNYNNHRNSHGGNKRQYQNFNRNDMISKERLSPRPMFFGPSRRIGVGLTPFSFPREWLEDFDPTDVVREFRAGEVKDKPKTLVQGSPLDSLSEAIWTKFVTNQQSSETFRKKVELWRDIYRVVRILNFSPDFKNDARNFPTYGLQVVGSTMSGFGSNTSDVDMCLLIRGSEVDQRYEAVDKLQTLCQTLKILPCVDNQELIYAKVPILKFRDVSRRLDVDLNCNNFVGIRNTHLLYAYAQMDWRLKPLVLVVKLWAQHHRINDAKNMTISSYSLVLMVIHFLQFGLEDPVLPVLHKMYPEKFSNVSNILTVCIHETMPRWESTNKQGIGELLILFLEYFAKTFDYTRNAISIRLGGTIPIKSAASYRSTKNDPHQWKYLCVEEPYDRTNTARSVYDREIFEKILNIFHVSWQRLLVTWDLNSIFSPAIEDDYCNFI